MYGNAITKTSMVRLAALLLLASIPACAFFTTLPEPGDVIAIASDTTAPTIALTAPVNGNPAVAPSAIIAVIFSEPVNPLTVTPLTFTLKVADGNSVLGLMTTSNAIAIFTPGVALSIGTTYTATLTTGIKDLAGNALESEYTWSFRTAGTIDNIAPTITLTNPAHEVTNVATNTFVGAIFSEYVDPLSINPTTFFLTGPGGVPVLGIQSPSGPTAIFSPLNLLAANTTYTATVTTGVKDLAGNALESEYIWSFTTAAPIDTTAPTIVFIHPADGATDVSADDEILVIFSEPMNSIAINQGTFALFGPGPTFINGNVTTVGTISTYTPVEDLQSNTTYTATIAQGVIDLAGNALAAGVTWTFTTGIIPDTTAPFVLFTNPSPGTTNVSIFISVFVTFNEALDTSTVTPATFIVTGPGSTVVDGTLTFENGDTTIRFDPINPYVYDTIFAVTATTGIEDVAGNGLSNDYGTHFTTEPSP